MNEILSYLFCSMRRTETVLAAMEKTLKKQRRFNRQAGLFALAGAAYVLWSEQERWKQKEEIRELSEMVHELREAKE